jgi:hypothetical protein
MADPRVSLRRRISRFERRFILDFADAANQSNASGRDKLWRQVIDKLDPWKNNWNVITVAEYLRRYKVRIPLPTWSRLETHAPPVAAFAQSEADPEPHEIDDFDLSDPGETSIEELLGDPDEPVRPEAAEATPDDPDDILPGLRIISDIAQMMFRNRS